MSQKFSHDDDELLIEQVREYPCIYDHANKDFKDHQIRENAWNKIGVVLLKKSEDCKLRWKNIRDNYLKQKRKQKQGTGSAASTRPSKWHLYEQLTFLELLKSERSRIQNCNVQQNTESSQNTQDSGDEDVQTDSESQSRIIEDDVGSPDSIHLNQPNPKILKRTNMDDRSRSNTPTCSSSTPSNAKAKLLHELEERSKHRLHVLSQLTHQKEEDEVDLFMRSIALMVKKLPPNLISQAKLQILTLVTNLQASSPIINIPHTQTQPHQPQAPTPTFSLNTSHNTSTPDDHTPTTFMTPYSNDYYNMK